MEDDIFKAEINCEMLFDVSYRDQIRKAFDSYDLNADQKIRIDEIRYRARELAYYISESCPPGFETELALTKLQEVIMWSKAAIEINEDEEEF